MSDLLAMHRKLAAAQLWASTIVCFAACTVMKDLTCEAQNNMEEQQERAEFAAMNMELVQMQSKTKRTDTHIEHTDGTTISMTGDVGNTKGVVGALPSDWPDRELLSSLYHELLIDDKWIAPTQAQLDQVQKQNILAEQVAWEQVDYEKWQPGELWPQTYRQYVGSGTLWAREPVSILSILYEWGLDKTSMVLDIGCGPLRFGRVLIPLLDRGHYHCVEPNRQLIQDGIKFELGYDLVQRKLPSFAVNADFLAPPGLPESVVSSDAAATSERPTYNFILAKSILTHTADDLFHVAISNIKPRFASTTRMLATILFPPCGEMMRLSNDTSISGWVYGDEQKNDPVFVCHDPEHLTKLLQVHGLVWDRIGTTGAQTMVSIYLRDHKLE